MYPHCYLFYKGTYMCIQDRACTYMTFVESKSRRFRYSEVRITNIFKCFKQFSLILLSVTSSGGLKILMFSPFLKRAGQRKQATKEIPLQMIKFIFLGKIENAQRFKYCIISQYFSTSYHIEQSDIGDGSYAADVRRSVRKKYSGWH